MRIGEWREKWKESGEGKGEEGRGQQQWCEERGGAVTVVEKGSVAVALSLGDGRVEAGHDRGRDEGVMLSGWLYQWTDLVWYGVRYLELK